MDQRPSPFARHLPILDWGRRYDRAAAASDLVAATVVTLMLIPQSLAYALLAGLPPETGLYASILPLLAYALFGSSRTLAVGPVAVVSLMTAAALGNLGLEGAAERVAAAAVLALLSGAMLLAMGVFRLGFLANFLSHPVIAGFIAAAGLLIALSQLGPLSGLAGGGQTLPQMLAALVAQAGGLHGPTLMIGVAALGFLLWARRGLAPLLIWAGLGARPAALIARGAPVLAVAATTLLAWALSLDAAGVAIVGDVPKGLPPLALPAFSPALWLALAGSALLISVIGFVESVSVAQTLAAKRRERIRPDQELIGLGAANLAAGVSGGYPVTGGIARSVVNHEAGAETPAAGALAALGILLAASFLTPLLHFLPKATLAATIVVAVLGLVDLGILRRAWRNSRADFAAVAATIAITLLAGVEAGVLAGVAISLLLFLWSSSRPHIAEVGLVPGTQHFRNVRRHRVFTVPGVLTLRVDESLYFANARFLEDYVLARVAGESPVRHVVLLCSAVNAIDLSALESLEALNARLSDMGIRLHLSEVKGPVTDRLQRTAFLAELSGRVFLTQYEAAAALGALPPEAEGRAAE